MRKADRVRHRVQQGDAKAADELLPLVYEKLRRLAARKMANEAARHTLHPTNYDAAALPGYQAVAEHPLAQPR